MRGSGEARRRREARRRGDAGEAVLATVAVLAVEAGETPRVLRRREEERETVCSADEVYCTVLYTS